MLIFNLTAYYSLLIITLLTLNKILDYYAALDPDENFAQGCEAMASIYKPHSILLQTDGANHTRYELMAKDKNLFKFIELNLRKIH